MRSTSVETASVYSRTACKLLILNIFFCLAIVSCVAKAAAQPCGTDYVVKKDESLTSIATRIYGSASQWRLIFYANQDRLGNNVSLLVPGLALRVPCLEEGQGPKPPEAAKVRAPASPPSPDQFVLSRLLKRVEFLTAEGYAPLTGRELPNGGMLTDVLTSSMELIKKESKGEFDYGISWVNDWSSHLNPLLSSRAFDAGFPWEKPECDEPEELDASLQYRCQRFFFSDPLYETFEVLYVRANSSLKFTSDDEIIGKKICLTVDNGTDDLDGEGRNWVKDNKVTLVRPASLQECFGLLDQRSVDAVVAPDMTGRSIAVALGIADKVVALPRPLAIQTVHVLVSKTHPQARTLLYYVNTALGKLRESGDYDRIVERHLSHFWSTHEPQKSPMGAQSQKGDTPNREPSKPEQGDSKKPERGNPDAKTSQARR
jgi:polar amino acid transport system substrate-binding protein